MIFMIQQIMYNQTVLYKENNEQLIWEQDALSFLRTWCLQHGSTFEGRKAAATHILKCRQKVPILISEKTKDILFPTSAYKKEDCIWLNYKYIVDIRKSEQGVKVIFYDGNEVSLCVSIRSIRRSLALCEKYYAYLCQ